MSATGSDNSQILRQALYDLRMIDNPDRRVTQLVRVMVNHHGLDHPELVALARAEVERSRCSAHILRTALEHLQYQEPVRSRTAIQNETERPESVTLSAEGDPELTRLANGLGLAAAFRLWLVSRVIDAGGVGQVTKTALEAQLPAFGITHSRRYLNRLLKRGNGMFWAISADGSLLHLRSYAKVAERLTALALEQNPDLVLTNAPGQKFKMMSVAGSIADFEARTLAAWLDSRHDAGMTNIALSTLAALFGRSPNTIRDWLKRAGVQVQHNYTQYAGQDEALIPDHASLYVTKQGGYAVTWQISSSYHPEPTPERQHKRIPRHVYHACQHVIETWSPVPPAGDCGTVRHSSDLSAEASAKAEGAKVDGGVYRTGTLFFAGADDMRKARKRVLSHLRRHQDFTIAHHVLLGFKQSPCLEKGNLLRATRYGGQGGQGGSQEIGIYECVDPDQTGTTRLHERDYKAQHRSRHRRQIAAYRDYLTEG